MFIDHGMGGDRRNRRDRQPLPGIRASPWGAGKDHGKRHPTLAENVVVGAGAKVLGAITIGTNTRIGAGSVVVRDVEAIAPLWDPGRVIHQSAFASTPSLPHYRMPKRTLSAT